MRSIDRSRRPDLGGESGATSLEYAVILGLVFGAAGLSAVALSRNMHENLASETSGVAATWGSAGGNAGGAPPGSGTDGTDPGQGAGGGGSGDSVPPAGAGNPSYVVFATTFDEPHARARWHFNGSWWQIENGGLQAGPVSGWNEMRSYVVNSDFGDGTVSWDATVSAGKGFGLFFHVSADPSKNKPFDGYSFQYDVGYGSGAFVLRKWIQGVQIDPPIAAAEPAAEFQWLGTTQHFELTTQGALITAKINGQTVLTCLDDSYSSGGVGFRLWSDSHASFDNLSIVAQAK